MARNGATTRLSRAEEAPRRQPRKTTTSGEDRRLEPEDEELEAQESELEQEQEEPETDAEPAAVVEATPPDAPKRRGRKPGVPVIKTKITKMAGLAQLADSVLSFCTDYSMKPLDCLTAIEGLLVTTGDIPPADK